MWTPDHAQFSMLESEPPADPDAMDAAVGVSFPLPTLICAAAAAADTESLVWGSCARDKGCSSGGGEPRAAAVERCCGDNGRCQRTLCMGISLDSVSSSVPSGYAGRCEAESKGHHRLVVEGQGPTDVRVCRHAG